MKHQIRKEAKVRRAAISDRAKQHADAIMLFAEEIEAKGKVLGLYYPKDEEFDVLRIPAEKLALPRTPKLCDSRILTFHAWREGDELEQGQYNIPEPLESAPITSPDILIVPLLAFDSRGYRLGYGGGYYDSTIKYLREAGDVICIALAYNEQEFDELPTEAHDQKLDIIITPRKVLRIS